MPPENDHPMSDYQRLGSRRRAIIWAREFLSSYPGYTFKILDGRNPCKCGSTVFIYKIKEELCDSCGQPQPWS